MTTKNAVCKPSGDTKICDGNIEVVLYHKLEHEFLHYVLVKETSHIATTQDGKALAGVIHHYQLLLVVDEGCDEYKVCIVIHETDFLTDILDYAMSADIRINAMVFLSYVDIDNTELYTVKTVDVDYFVFGALTISPKLVQALKTHHKMPTCYLQ